MINNSTFKRTCAALLVGTFLTTACTMSPDYKQPDMPVSSWWNFSSKDDANAQTPLASEMGWNDFFLSEELRNLIAKGLKNNRDLRVAALNIQAAQAQYRVQRSNLMPTINANAGMTRQQNPGMFPGGLGGGVFSQYTANVANTAYEIDLFGRVRSLNESALQDYLATEEARNTVQIALVSEIATAYLTYLADREQSILSQQTLDSQQKSFDLATRKYKVGVGTKLELRQVETLLERARVDQIAFSRQTMLDQNALELLVGAPLDEKEVAAKFENADTFTAPIQAGLPSDLLQNRPDIRQAEHVLRGANADIGAARAAFFPRISLTAAFGTAGGDLSDLFKSGSKAWSFSPQMTVPIFTGGRNKANLDIAKIRKEISIVQYEKAIQVAFREVSDALVSRKTLVDELDAQQRLVDATQDAYDIAARRHDKGVADYLTVLDARRNLYAAQQGAITTRLKIMQNFVELYAALGGGQMYTDPAVKE
jgi:outer membrane protein, multidrug efflux system